MSERDHVGFEVDESIGVITLDRPEVANAQSAKVLVELDEAWTAADEDPDVKVIVLRSTGRHFSAGHDMADGDEDIARVMPVTELLYDWETRGYLAYARRWRDVPKPSIAAVQGKCIAAGLMLCWPCDLIMAADDAEFSDPVIHMGVGAGVEYHGHTWELGPRTAKEMLFTGGPVSAADAHRLGMVNHVVPLEDLMDATMALARRIARQDAFALRMAKRAVNRTLDIQGFSAAVDHCFDLHHFGHARAVTVTGRPTFAGHTEMKEKNRGSL
jgi:enoyl-CoA hydratase